MADARVFFAAAPVLLASLLLPGCRSGDRVNVTVSEIQVLTAGPLVPRDTLEVSYLIDATKVGDQLVETDFYLLHRPSLTTVAVAATAQEAELEHAFYLGRASAARLRDGETRLLAAFEIPTAIVEFGEHIVVAIVDPDNLIAEADEEDNQPGETNADHAFDSVLIEAGSDHDLHIAEFTLSDGAVILDAPSTDPDVGITLRRADVIGHIDAVYTGVVDGLSAGMFCEVLLSTGWQPVRLWDAAAQAYADDLVIDFAYKDDEHFFGIDIDLEPAQVSDLYAGYDPAGDNSISLRCGLVDLSTLAELDLSNNSIEVSVPLFFFDNRVASAAVPALRTQAAPTVTTYGGSYGKTYGDRSKFAVSLDFAGEIVLDGIDAGGSFSASGEIDLYIFNAFNTLFSIDYSGSGYVGAGPTGYASEMVIFNNVAFSEEKFVAEFSKAFEKSWEERKVLASTRFTVGPIPVKVEAGVEGDVGLALEVGYQNAALSAEGDIFSTDFGAFADGGVDLLVASAGVEAELTLIDDVLSLESSVDLSPIFSHKRIDYAIDLTDEIDVISGRFGIFAELSGIKWCKKFGIPYPCGSKKTRYDLWLYQTPSVFQKEWTLYGKSGSISL